MVQFNKLRLSGFKSFVDPTEVIIDPGMTGIVGPNGCGKSNLVEALRWVMGETSAKRMRGSEMDDVIFAGSSTRPARNLAEVTLVLDNSARSAPAMFNDHDTIEVTRRIDRGAGSSYRLNGKEVRARDVQLLFADAATGAHSTALVSQGRVGALINAKPTDRRALLEEAAGITGLHSRRHEAELRLRAAETNLERLDDVVSALETQLQGLKKQARQAARYRRIADQIRRTEALALHLEAEAGKMRQRETVALLEEAQRHVADLTERTASRATEQAEAAAALPALREGEATAAAALQRLLIDQDHLDREEAQAIAAREQTEERRRQLERDLDRAREQAADAAAAHARLDDERSALQQAAANEQDTRATTREELENAQAAVAEQEGEVQATAERLAADEAQAAALQRRAQELAQRVEKLRRQIDDVNAQRDALGAKRVGAEALDAAAAQVAEAEGALERLRGEAEAAEARLGECRTEETRTRDLLQDREAERARLEAEVAALSALLDPGDSERWPPLVDSVQVAPGYEVALAAALGDDIAAPADPAASVRWETLAPYASPDALPPGAEPLGRHVQGPPALDRRLAQIGLVADDAEGRRLHADLRPGQRLVTKAGALWRWDGFSADAEARTSAAKRLEQRNRLAELSLALEPAAEAAREARSEHDTARAAAEDAATAERAARGAVTDAFGQVDTMRQRHGALVQEAASVASRLSGLDETMTRLAADMSEAEAAFGAAREEDAGLPDLTAARDRLAALRAELNARRTALTDCQSTFDRLTREAEARTARLAAIEEEKQSWARRSEDAERHSAELTQRLAATEQEIALLAARPQELAARRDALVEQIAAAERTRKQAADALALGETRLADADRALKADEHALAAAREERVRAEAAQAQAEQALETVGEKVRDRLDCPLDAVLELAELDPGQDLPARDEIEAKLARLTRERENIGAVNLRAEVEAQELEEQITRMQSERADLVSAIARLRQGIASLNREGRQRLLAAFETVNQHFSELFVRLFGGGRAHLKLTEAEDPLDAGLEILASPPGKRLQVMSLLSGGEQALTALSLLFAVFLTNPAPICVLDEVDAPLDDANVDRLCTLLDELCAAGSTRFLMITHHRMTMARVDRLFGVTMAERGISRLVSVDLGAAERLRESA